MPTKPKDIDIDYDAFRDHIATVDDQGKRAWIFPKRPSGRFHRLRSIVAWVLISFLFIGPFLCYNGKPLFLFNILERKFILFGLAFWPQDFHLFALTLVTLFVFVILFTVAFGRVWCGWACPQTLFMEMVFRKIEYWIEGDAPKQRKLAKSPWTREKIVKKGSKWVIFYLVSFMVAHTLMAYVLSIDEMTKIITEGPEQHWGKFTFVMVFSGVFFFVFAWFREQACIVICPYGRLQGALLDKNSIVVHYDHVRGEPRERMYKNKERNGGDCIACGLCVQVCPTGIDIKNGTQMECVNCTACIDACDEVMDKVGFEKGLIRFASFNQIAEGEKFKLSKRIVAYSVVLVGLLSFLGFSLANRSDVELTLLRTKGTFYQITETGDIQNLYNFQVINKTQKSIELSFQLLKPDNGNVKVIGKNMLIGAQDNLDGSLFIELPKGSTKDMKESISVGVFAGDTLLTKVKTTFLGPPN